MPGERIVTNSKYASLSVKDLLEARDQYHFHLMNKANVVGTAIGRYLIRKDDPWPTSRSHGHDERQRRSSHKARRTFESSEVRDYSWPCVLVLVNRWVDAKAFGTAKADELDPKDMVPRTLYLPDGRTVPVCVVEVSPAAPTRGTIPRWHWPSTWIGPGYPLIVDHQEQERVASIGCLVSDGHTTYALTNRHVCGDPGEVMYSIVGGRRARVGQASSKQATRIPFSEMYPDYPGRRTYLNFDVGLVEIDDLNDWTSQVYGLPPVGEIVDLHEANLGLSLIGAKVEAYGAASGLLRGQINALFYRYKSVGGYDYVSDFLIAPSSSVETQMGDSGTVWHLVERNGDGVTVRPLAVEWGGQAFATDGSGDKQFHFALATSLSNVCKWLDVELVRQNATGVRPYWGQTGHYGIATLACDSIKNRRLRELMKANLSRISFTKDLLDPKAIADAVKHAKQSDGFMPLADVPDLTWKNLFKKVKGGRDTQVIGQGRTTGPEHPAHYADIDEPNADGKTLRQLCLEDPANLDVKVWQEFYRSLGHDQPAKQGLLPFRIWQFFDAMVDALKAKDKDRFVAAAGIVSHYVTDACQPLHGSRYADGYKDQPVTIEHHHKDGTPYTEQSNVGAGVHSTYETKMVDRWAEDILAGMPTYQGQYSVGKIKCGKDAAMEVIRLMESAAKLVAPTELVDQYVDAPDRPSEKRDALWDKFGDATIQVMAQGADVLAAIWEAAWRCGGGSRLRDLTACSPKALRELYVAPSFVPSLYLDQIGAVLK